MIVEMLAQLFEGGAREVQERTPVDVGERHAVRKVIERDRPGAQRAGQLGGERLRLRDVAAADDDDQLVELAECLRVLAIARHVRLAGGQQMKLGRLEPQSGDRDDRRDGGEPDRAQDDGERMPPAPGHHATQRPTDGRGHRQSAVGLPVLPSAGRRTNMPSRPTAA